MGCSKTGKLQPTLQQFYNGIDKELYEGKDLYHILDPDVSYLAKQGVLMLNAALTTEDRKSTRLNSSHSAKSRMPSSA